MKKVFIDGSSGTTGLRIADRLKERPDLQILTLPDELRHDTEAKRDIMNRADVVFLCLPDDVARSDVELVENPDVCVIDTSTAHRTDDAWVYGFPEVGSREASIAKSKRIANPGCHASGFIALVAPLVEEGILSKNAELSCFSMTGYSGGGKKMIATYEGAGKECTFGGSEKGENDSEGAESEKLALLKGTGLYGLTQNHKHLKEMKKLCGLEKMPVFCPIVGNFYSGMQVTVPLFRDMTSVGQEEIRDLYRSYYKGPVVRFSEDADKDGFLYATLCAGKDNMLLGVYGNEERFILTAVFDNLGKGASGAAVQNMNISLGLDPITALVL